MAEQTMIRKYKGNMRVAQFGRDAASLARDGWKVQSTDEQRVKPGIVRLLGPLARTFGPTLVLVATYVRDVPDASPASGS